MRINHETAGYAHVDPIHLDSKRHEIQLGDMCRLSDEKIEALLLANDESTDPLAPVTKGWEYDPYRMKQRGDLRIQLQTWFKIVGFSPEGYLISIYLDGGTKIGQALPGEIQFAYRTPTKETK